MQSLLVTATEGMAGGTEQMEAFKADDDLLPLPDVYPAPHEEETAAEPDAAPTTSDTSSSVQDAAAIELGTAPSSDTSARVQEPEACGPNLLKMLQAAASRQMAHQSRERDGDETASGKELVTEALKTHMVRMRIYGNIDNDMKVCPF